MVDEFDVVVVGSGGAGMMAALRAAHFGLKVLVIEKTSKYGGTTATSGGVIWIPNNGLGGEDSREETLRYIDAVSTGPVRQDRVEACIDGGPEMLDFLKSLDIKFNVIPWSDYFPEAPGARMDRSIIFPKYDGTTLGKHFLDMREQFTRFKLFNRYTMDFAESFTISGRSRGWLLTLAKVTGRYWLDLSVRLKTRRDRWFSLGAALVAPLRQKLADRGVEVRLDTELNEFEYADGRVCGVKVTRFGRKYTISAKRGVIVCAGGFEWSQKLRDKFYTIPGDIRWASSPEGANNGKALEAGMALGAATEFTETPWMVPVMEMPIKGISNFGEIHQAVFDVGRPHSVCVNRNGHRFVNEAWGYDRFGNAMLDDHAKTGANAPCWLIFDATFRQKFPAGGFMPTAIMPDRKIPLDWWDHHIFKADTIGELAAKIDIDPAALAKTVANMNEYAKTGVDTEFGRGETVYDQSFGDPSLKPNVCLGSIGKAPYYAMVVNVGDLGTKGGLKTDASARVLDGNDKPIPGLYAAGNASGTPFGNCYPGAGGTIGPAMVFGFIAANDIARANTPAQKTPQGAGAN
jgi:3-oxosteroid 1-dehydrogenase